MTLAPTLDPATDEFLTPAVWADANRHLTCKAIAEFAHERILAPENAGGDAYLLTSDDDAATYRFTARRRALNHWSIDPASLTRDVDGDRTEIDAQLFILDTKDRLGIPDDLLPVYLEEISSTLAGSSYKRQFQRYTSAELAAGVTNGADQAADFQAVESSMTEGHPCFVANNGRLGFGSGDYLAYAPECGRPIRLEWIAVHRNRAAFTALSGLDYRDHLLVELGDRLGIFEAELEVRGCSPEDYFLMPVHPWQWENKLRVTFAGEIASRNIVYLGTGVEQYQAQQSIRTFFNRDHPDRSYVKTSLSILNMGFMRGLSAEYMAATPAINEWLAAALNPDAVLRERGFTLLRETAAIGYRPQHLHAATAPGSPYRKMLAALWRESPLPQLEDGEQLMTMAALLHRDVEGISLVSELVRRSGLTGAQWLRSYADAYLIPVAHCLFAFELAFMPHGENLILVLRDGVPVRAIMKDLGEEIVVMGSLMDVPEHISRVRAEVPEKERALAIFTDVMDCFLRFLASTMADDGMLTEGEFWAVMAGAIKDYQRAHPELAGQFAKYDLFAGEFDLSCLNRLQLRNNKHMLDLTDQSGGLQFAGKLANPLAAAHR
ncbi:siderophore synthetase component [Arthrobacter pigmenti]|uniref:Siderophore synthetase component n=1 Tax=Arthrobacter pigmenti TaxID=271432 RepID=A0A846RTN1_9MICC|nr:IucA/IucC family siderophore biosynthesis protein [Arthrobacter pigmenti]NJC24399.1 siderophore synthetase component [Arthrobacter pigmenti]